MAIGFHIVHYPLRHGSLFNIVAVFRRSDHSERGDVAAYRAELEGAYRNARILAPPERGPTPPAEGLGRLLARGGAGGGGFGHYPSRVAPHIKIPHITHRVGRAGKTA